MASLEAQRQARLAGAAMQTHAHSQVTQNSTPVVQRARTIGDAAVMPAHSAGQRETAPVRSPAGRACISSAAASRLRCRTAAGNIADTLAQLLARHTTLALQTALLSLPALLARARMQVRHVLAVLKNLERC